MPLRFVPLAAALALGLGAAAGCTDFSEVLAGQCGNYVLEPGEDCDDPNSLGDGTCGAVGTANACTLVCTDDASCPLGWGCGGDGRCRSATGTFEVAAGSPWRFDVETMAAGDIDGDGNVDLVGHQRDEVQIRFGAADGTFASELRVVTQQPTGEVTFADFDGDALLDVVVPIQDGLFVLRGSEERTLEPIAYAPTVLGIVSMALVPLESFPQNLVTEVLAIDFDNDLLAFVGSSAGPFELPAPIAPPDLVRPLPVASLYEARGEQLALAPRGSPEVWIIGASGGIEPPTNTLSPDLISTIFLPPGAAVAEGAAFADFDGDGALDVLISARDGLDELRVAVALNLGASEFSTATFMPIFDRDAPRPRWFLAAGDLNGDGAADYVYPDGILIRSGFASPVFTTTVAPVDAPWSDAAIGDFNGDGMNDVAVATRLEERIDIYLSAGTGLFNHFPIPADGVPKLTPRTLVTADFDGDFVDDLAFAVGGGDEDQIYVLYGHRQGAFASPVAMGSMDRVTGLAPIVSVSSLETADAITDLLVSSAQASPDGNVAMVSIMRGSSSRRLIAPFTLRDGDDGAHVPKRAIVGDFSSPPDGIRDILAVAQPPGELDPGTARQSYLFLLPGAGGGDIAADSVQVTQMPAAAGFDVRCAVYAVGDLDANVAAPEPGIDELFGVDASAGCASTDSGASNLMVARPPTSEGLIEVTALDLSPLALSRPQRIRLVDLDRDGDLDLLALFRGDRAVEGGGESAPGSGVAVVWNDGGELSLSNVIQLPGEGAPGMLDLATLHLDDDGYPDLAIATAQGVWTARYQPEAKAFSEPVHAAGEKGARAIIAGDANGDGVTDLLVQAGVDVEVYLGVPAPSRGDLAAIEEAQP